MPGYESHQLKELVETVQHLYDVKINMIDFDPSSSLLHLYTASENNNLSVFNFPLTEKNEETDIQKILESLRANPKGAKNIKYAKECMLEYWVQKTGLDSEKMISNHRYLRLIENYKRLSELASDEKTSLEDFKKIIELKHNYRSHLGKVITQYVIEPFYRVKGYTIRGKKRPKTEEIGLVARPDKKILALKPADLGSVDPAKVRKIIMLNSEVQLEQVRIEKEIREKNELEKTRQYRV
jgi:hypothetical protein